MIQCWRGSGSGTEATFTGSATLTSAVNLNILPIIGELSMHFHATTKIENQTKITKKTLQTPKPTLILWISKSRGPKFSHTTFQCQKMLTKIADCWEILEEYCGIFTFYGNTDSAMFYLSGFEVLETGTYVLRILLSRTNKNTRLVLSIQFCCFIASSVYRNLITT